MENEKTIKGYKGFNPDLTCRGFQYKVGETYKTEKAVACSEGFHFCENPFEVLSFYHPSSGCGVNRFCKVEGSGDFDESEDNKIACTEIKIVKEIGIRGIIKEGIEFILDKLDRTDYEKEDTEFRSISSNKNNHSVITNEGEQAVAVNTGYQSLVIGGGEQSAVVSTSMGTVTKNKGSQSLSVNTGNRSAATNEGNGSITANTGHHSAVSNSGKWSVAANTGESSIAEIDGDYSISANTGEHSISISSGYLTVAATSGGFSVAENSGYQSVAVGTGDRTTVVNRGDLSSALCTGYCSIVVNKGDESVAVVNGESSSVSVEGSESVAVATGIYCKAKGKLGCWIVLTEREDWDDECHAIKDIKAFKVDGKTIKENTYYRLENGKAVECELGGDI